MLLKIEFPGRTMWKFLGNRFVEAHIHGNAQVKRNSLWKCISILSFCDHLRNLEYGSDMFYETSFLTRTTRYKAEKAFLIDIAVKTSQKTVFFYRTSYPCRERLINRNSTATEL
jgi:hypothetical protein